MPTIFTIVIDTVIVVVFIHNIPPKKNGPVDPVLSDVWLVVGLGRR